MSVRFQSGPFGIALRNPDFGNGEVVDTKVDYWTAMSGKLWSTKSTTGRRFNLTFSEISRLKQLELKKFLQDVNGRKVRYTDSDGVVWTGWIRNNPIDLTNTGKGTGTTEPRFESFQLNIEFEVEVG